MYRKFDVTGNFFFIVHFWRNYLSSRLWMLIFLLCRVVLLDQIIDRASTFLLCLASSLQLHARSLQAAGNVCMHWAAQRKTIEPVSRASYGSALSGHMFKANGEKETKISFETTHTCLYVLAHLGIMRKGCSNCLYVRVANYCKHIVLRSNLWWCLPH
jgi:hypothetical protein